MVALGIGFGLSVLLLGLATARLAARAIDQDRRAAAEGTAAALLRVEDLDAALLEELVGRGVVVGAELIEGGVVTASAGQHGHHAVEHLGGGRVLRLHLESAERTERGSLPGLLFFYVGLTASASRG